MAPGLNYGQQCYEGMKAFRDPSGNINMFRPNMNAERMQHSASFISIPGVPTEHFLECCKLAVGMNAAYVPPHETGAAMYVRPLLFGSSAQLGLNPPEEYTFCVFVVPTGVYHGTNPVDALILEQFDRAAPEGTGSAKIGGNYAPVLRWSEKAHHDGYGITLHLDSKTRTVIDEFSTSAFIGVKKDGDKVKLIASNSKNVIKSVTADSVLKIGQSFGWEAEEREVHLLLQMNSTSNTDFSRSRIRNSVNSMKSLLLVPRRLLSRSSQLHTNPRARSSLTKTPPASPALFASSSFKR
jgi:branched-chain amino acid aminotransferase